MICLGLDIIMKEGAEEDNTKVCGLNNELIGGIKLPFTEMGKTAGGQFRVGGGGRIRGSIWDMVSLRCLEVQRSLD